MLDIIGSIGLTHSFSLQCIFNISIYKTCFLYHYTLENLPALDSKYFYIMDIHILVHVSISFTYALIKVKHSTLEP